MSLVISTVQTRLRTSVNSASTVSWSFNESLATASTAKHGTLTSTNLINTRTITSSGSFNDYTGTPYVEIVAYVHEIESTVMTGPETCENYGYWGNGLESNPDVAGIGIILAFLVTACAVLLLTLVAYAGGFLPNHYLKRADRRVFRANSRNQTSKWRAVIENITLSFSDQQIVTGLAIMIAGFHEMLSTDMTAYHWNTIVYLAWLSSSVHIASLTLLRDVLNRNLGLRNIRVAAMLVLLALLATALWPTRYYRDVSDWMGWSYFPTRCWFSKPDRASSYRNPNAIISYITLFGAYSWKLSQLFAPSRNWNRKWLRAKPEAAVERLLRRLVASGQTRWLTRPAYWAMVVLYITFIVYAESAESFMATVMFMCLTVPWGILNMMVPRARVPFSVRDDEASWSFGQVVPLLLLLLPMFALFEISTNKRRILDASTGDESLALTSSTQHPEDHTTNLSSVLLENGLSRSASKLNSDSADAPDPIIDHIMQSTAFKCAFWTFWAGVLGLGLAVMVTAGIFSPSTRISIFIHGGPPFLALVPLATLLVLPFSRRLR